MLSPSFFEWGLAGALSGCGAGLLYHYHSAVPPSLRLVGGHALALSGASAAAVFAWQGAWEVEAVRAAGEIGASVGLAYALSASLLFLYPLQVPWQAGCYAVQRYLGWNSLAWAPLRAPLPLPWLRQHLVAAAGRQPRQAGCRLRFALRTPGQREAALAAWAELQRCEIEHLLRQRRFADLIALRGRWLPGVRRAPPVLLAVREAARYLYAAVMAQYPYHRIQHLKHAIAAVRALHARLAADPSPLARQLHMSMPVWKELLVTLSNETKASLIAEIPNPFHAGEPLTPQRGQEVFKGREDLIARLQRILLDPRKAHSIALLGPRRCGKTSLLYMLPRLLPEVIWIFFDLQDNPIDSPKAFFRALVRRTQSQAHADRRIRIPDLPPGPPLEAGAQWLEMLDQAAAEYRVMLCFDEFERLENVFLGDQRQLRQLMGLFRATLQHRRNLRLLLCGVAPFSELDPLWSDHFINLRELRVGYLSRCSALELLTAPVPRFPPKTIPRSVAERIYRRCGGQPYLLQLYGSYLVQQLNEEGRMQARTEDVATVEERILDESTYYFRNTLHSAPPRLQEGLLELARGTQPQLDAAQQRWLSHRLLLDKQGALAIPILARWLRLNAE